MDVFNLNLSKFIFINGETHIVHLKKNKSPNIKYGEEYNVFIRKGQDVVYETDVMVGDDKDKYINAIKVAIKNYLESSNHDAYKELVKWKGHFPDQNGKTESKISNLEIKVNELENRIKNMKSNLKIT